MVSTRYQNSIPTSFDAVEGVESAVWISRAASARRRTV